MPELPTHRLPEEFGGNEWLVDELYEQYQQNKNSVDSKWWPLFESFESDAAGSAAVVNGSAKAQAVETIARPSAAPAAAP
ncbi:2-oxoglutarate dehydrogenase E1 subunit family protein, partial [Sinomonas sp. G460-2]|uniref:2-oxoglutarate dehydrogenase E1 subunit family protein n=1 Tax=Sinomonas sp. G460-2 TaxID=3393464 RepID=UPI0039EE0FCB